MCCPLKLWKMLGSSTSTVLARASASAASSAGTHCEAGTSDLCIRTLDRPCFLTAACYSRDVSIILFKICSQRLKSSRAENLWDHFIQPHSQTRENSGPEGFGNFSKFFHKLKGRRHPPTDCGHTTKRQLRASSLNCEIWGNANIRMYKELISSFHRRHICMASEAVDLKKNVGSTAVFNVCSKMNALPMPVHISLTSVIALSRSVVHRLCNHPSREWPTATVFKQGDWISFKIIYSNILKYSFFFYSWSQL